MEGVYVRRRPSTWRELTAGILRAKKEFHKPMVAVNTINACDGENGKLCEGDTQQEYKRERDR
jgi:hypothetical protein